MKLAILGTDEYVLPLIEAALPAGHEIVWLADLADQQAVPVRTLLPQISLADNWEAVLDHALADAVIVGRGTCSEEEYHERLKRLVADGIPSLVVHPIGTSVLPYYELDMVRREVKAPLLHYSAFNQSDRMQELANWLTSGHPTVGPIHHVAWVRSVLRTDRKTVLAALCRDAEGLLALLGRVNKVSAVGPKTDDTNYAGLNVQMTGQLQKPAHWSVATTDGPSTACVTLAGERGQVVVTIPDDPARAASWSVDTVEQDDVRQRTELPARRAPQRTVQRLALAAETPTKDSQEASNWDTATRAMELVDAVQLSLQRGRVIEVYHQQVTEQLAFKGIMSAIGCGLLLLGLLVILLAGALGDTFGLPLIGHWPLLLLALLAVFLLLQLVPITRSGGGGHNSPNPGEQEPNSQ